MFGLSLDQSVESGNISLCIIDSKGIKVFLENFLPSIQQITDLNLTFAEWVLKYTNLVDGPFIDNTALKACDKCWISKVILAQPNFAGIGLNLTPLYCNLVCKKNQQKIIYGKGITLKEEKQNKT